MTPEKANTTGNRLENWVDDYLEHNGYERVQATEFFAARELDQPIYSKQCIIGKNIYGKQRRVDFILYHPRLWAGCLVVQCKWQASSGSVDEKYPFEVLSIEMGEFPTIIVLDGNGYSAGAKQWLEGQAGKNKLLHVFDLGEMSRFASTGRL